LEKFQRDLHKGKSTSQVKDEQDADEDANIAGHELKFVKRPQDFDPMARIEEASDYVVLDPRTAKKL
jgi:hypothetical protein